MPNPHFRVSIISRGGGRSALATAAYGSGSKLSSAVAAAAYRSGEVLHDAHAGKTFNYTRKENIVHTEIITPARSPLWATDRQALWNSVEFGEKRKDAQLARSIIASLPRELDNEQNIQLVREFIAEQFTAQGMIADIAIHDKEASDGHRNPHVHIMLTLREVDKNGFSAKKNREWNKTALLEAWRFAWEKKTNGFLEAAGFDERLNLSSYEQRGIDKIPQEYMGYAANAVEQKGIQTRRGDRNREIVHQNAIRELLGAAYAANGPDAPLYTDEEIDAYYRRQWTRAVALDEPDFAALERIERQAAGREEQEGQYYAAQISSTTWYGAREVRTFEPGRGRKAFGHNVEHDHWNALSQWVGTAYKSANHYLSETVARVACHLRDRAFEYGRNVVERSSSWVQRESERAARTWGRELADE